MPGDKLLKTLRPCCAKEVTDWCAAHQESNFENVSLHCIVCTRTITYQVATGWIARTGDTMPTSETSITVEQALAELFLMFPDKWWELHVISNHGVWYRVKVYGKPTRRSQPSLAACMAEVKRWKESQQ